MEIGKQIRLCGWAGVLAAVIGFVAEMLLYGGFYGGAEYYRVSRQIMSEIPLSRLIWGGALGPIEAIFYLIGFWHIYLALKPGSQRLAQIVFAAFSAMMIVGGAFHSAFVYTGLITRALNTVQAVDLPVLKTLLSQSDTYIRLLYRVTFAFGLTGTLAFVWAVWFKKTLYPRWLVFFTPTLLILLVQPLARYIPAPLGGIVLGGSVSLCFLLFFSLSVFLLRGKGK